MNNKNRDDSEQMTPDVNTQVSGGSDSRHSQHQWLVQSFNEMKEDGKRLNERIDQIYMHLSEVKSDTSVASAIVRMEINLSGIEQRMGALEAISKILGEHSVQLSGLSGIDKKLDKLDDIDRTISKTKVIAGAGVAVITACAGITWFIFGNYLIRVINALHTVVLKQ